MHQLKIKLSESGIQAKTLVDKSDSLTKSKERLETQIKTLNEQIDVVTKSHKDLQEKSSQEIEFLQS